MLFGGAVLVCLVLVLLCFVFPEMGGGVPWLGPGTPAAERESQASADKESFPGCCGHAPCLQGRRITSLLGADGGRTLLVIRADDSQWQSRDPVIGAGRFPGSALAMESPRICPVMPGPLSGLGSFGHTGMRGLPGCALCWGDHSVQLRGLVGPGGPGWCGRREAQDRASGPRIEGGSDGQSLSGCWAQLMGRVSLPGPA